MELTLHDVQAHVKEHMPAPYDLTQVCLGMFSYAGQVINITAEGGPFNYRGAHAKLDEAHRTLLEHTVALLEKKGFLIQEPVTGLYYNKRIGIPEALREDSA